MGRRCGRKNERESCRRPDRPNWLEVKREGETLRKASEVLKMEEQESNGAVAKTNQKESTKGGKMRIWWLVEEAEGQS